MNKQLQQLLNNPEKLIAPALIGATALGLSALVFRKRAASPSNSPQHQPIRSGESWKDENGVPIQAHGGGVLKYGDLYYWYGENKAGLPAPDGGRRRGVVGVSCYSSPDLVNWKNEGVVLSTAPRHLTSDIGPARVIERPKVLYNSKTKLFVMWLHLDSRDYSFAHAGIAVSESPCGPFRYQGAFRPIGGDEDPAGAGVSRTFRDMTVMQADDGHAYVFYASEGNATLYIARLSDDYTDIARPAIKGETWDKAFVDQHREAPAPFQWRGKTYIFTSGTTGWDPNPTTLHVADNILGPYELAESPFPQSVRADSWRSQPTFVLPAPHNPDGFIFMGDRWTKQDLGDSRYVWLPFIMAEDADVMLETRESWDMSFFGKK